MYIYKKKKETVSSAQLNDYGKLSFTIFANLLQRKKVSSLLVPQTEKKCNSTI